MTRRPPSLQAATGHAVPTRRVLSVRRDHDRSTDDAPCARAFLVRTLRQAPRLDARPTQHRQPRPVAPVEDRQVAAEARDRPHPRGARRTGHAPDRHRARVGHRRLRNGDVDAARRAAGDHDGVGKLWRRLGHRRGQAAQARCRGRHRALRRAARPDAAAPVERHLLHLERYDLGRPRAERRLDPRRPRGADAVRCNQRGVRAGAAVGEARCRHLQLAKGARRRRRPTAC